ncbi:MAG: tetratricopeptide repeat protein [Cyanobacteriota bacterium]|nr:tetratricopeptide repeat protein [Cyanobacteriota bacterium]
MIGQLVDKRYQLIKVIDEKFWGQTYLAEDTRRPGSPQCVVKQLRLSNRNVETQETILILFQEKASKIDKLSQHEQIPSLLAYFKEDNNLYLVEDCIVGTPLTAQLKPGKTLSEKQAIGLLEEVLEILAFVHNEGAVHGKIKPANIIRRSSDGLLVLLGFGLGGEIEEMSVEEKELLSQANRKTEENQLADTAFDRAEKNVTIKQNYNSDIYAVGIIAIQALTGLSPRELTQLKTTDTDSQATIRWRSRSSCSPELANIVDRTLDYQSEEAYNSASEVLEALKKIEAYSLKVVSQPIATTETETEKDANLTTKQLSKNTKWTAVGLLGLLTLGGIGVYIWQLQSPSKAKNLYDRGQELAKQGDKPGAIAFYNQALKLNPEDAQTYYQRANARYRQGEVTEAIEDYSEAIRLNSEYGDAYYNRGLAYYAQGNYGNAIADFTNVLKLNPDDADAYYQRGLNYYQIQEYSLAIEDYSSTILLQPNNVNAYTSRGLAKAAAGDKPGSLADYTEAQRIQPNDPLIFYNRGRARFHLADYRGAMEDYTKVLELQPNYADAYVNRCSAYLNLAAHTEAVADCSKAIALNPKDEGAYNNRCIAYLNMGEHQRAAQDCSITIGMNPTSAKAYSNRGLARSQSGDKAGAIEDFSAAISLSPSDGVAYNNRGQIYSEEGEYSKAIEDFAQAVRLNPNYADAYFNRGIVRAGLGDRLGAIDDLRKSANLFLEQGRADDYQRAQNRINQFN